MGIINQQCKFVRNRHHFDPALYMCSKERLLYLVHLYPEVSAHRNGRKCIVNTESSRCWYFHFKVHLSFHTKINAQLSRLIDQLQFLRIKICRRIKAIGLKRTGMPLQHRLHMGIILIDDSQTALFKQKSFTELILFKICVFIGSDMIRLQIGENTDLKGKALRSVELQSLRSHLHHHDLTALLFHLLKIFLEQEGFRCRIICRDVFITDNGFYGSHQSYLIARLLQNGLDQVGCRSLSLCSCDPDYPKPVCRMPEISSRDKCHGIPGILHLNDGHISVRR